MNIAENHDTGGGVKVAFTSPVGTAAVREWFQGKLAGPTDEGKAFSLTTKADGSGASESLLAME